MVTNQLMLRKMGDFDVIQRTKDSFFNATFLLKQWNAEMNMNKEMKDYFKLKSTYELVNTIMKTENRDGGNLPYHKSHANKGNNAGTWMSPILFIDFAMWINPTFKYNALKFVSDHMLYFRNLSGDAYRRLATQVQKIVERNFMPVAMQKIGEALNWVIFNCHEKEVRNRFGDERKQNELYQFELKVADLIDDGFLKSYESLIQYLRKQYFKHNKPF